MKKLMRLYAWMLIALCACNDPYADTTYQVYDVNPIGTYLSSHPDDFSEWVEVLKYADLYNAINQASEAFTAFVPDNEAMKQYYQAKNVSSIEGLGKEFAVELAKFHIIHDSINIDTFLAGGKLETRTLSDDNLSVSFNEDEGEGGINSVYINNEALVKPPVEAIETSNGFIYVLKGVLSPLVESVYERIEQSAGDYSIFKEILDLTQWSDSLNTIYDQIRQSDGTYLSQKRNYTLLAVSDQSFKKSGIYSVNDLITRLNAKSDYTDKNNELFLYTAYHIIAGSYSLLELKQFQTASKIKLITTLSENVLQITEEEHNKEYYLNYDGGEDKRAQFIDAASDVSAKNGMVHQVDAYLPVWESVIPVEVIFDVTDYPEVADWVNTYGPTLGAGELAYQTSPSKAGGEGYITITQVNCYDVYYPNPCNQGSYPAGIQYRTGREDSDWSNLMYHDHMIINVGTNGYVEMTTPAIIQGKYKVILHVSYATSQLFILRQTSGSNGGEMRFTFDPNTDNEISITGKPYTTYPDNGTSSGPALGRHSWVMFNELDFAKTGTHRFRITVLDPAASVSTVNYRLGIDYIQFVPITDEEPMEE